MTILITGNAGLLGSRLADWLTENSDYKIIGIDDLSGGYIENVNKDVRFYKRNLNEDLSDIFEEHKPDVVYHYAAYAAEGLSPFIRRYNYTNNLLASANLINNSIEHNVSRFIFASSMSVYGEKHSPPFDENMEQAPIDPYGVAKFSVEQDLAIAFAQHGLQYTIIRPHNFYGRNQNIWDKYRNVLGIWMYQIINDMQPTIFGDGKQTRAFSYVDDSIKPFWNASQNDNCVDQIINLGGIESCSILDACELLIEISGTTLTPKFLEQRHEVKHAFSTWEKSVDLLDFKHETNLKTGLEKMWDWAIKQPNRDRFVWEDYEVHKGIYSYWK
jgi:UDP-glucose 4-epimerase